MRWLPWLMAAATLGCASGATDRLVDETFELASAREAGSARGPTPPAPDLTGPVTREQVLALVVARDPGLAARALRVRAALHTARAEGALPAPEINGQVWNLPLARPYALGEANMYMVEVRQMFPAAGVRDARARAQTEEARGMVAELTEREQEVLQRAGQAYADYVHGTLDHRVHAGHLALLAEMLDAVRARLTAGGTTLGDVARVEAERARTRREIARINGEIAQARATLNALLLRAPDAPLGPPADLAPQTVRLPTSELLGRAARARSVFAQARTRIGAAHARSDAARAEAIWPEVTVALSYWQDPQQRPGVGTTVAMSLPWVWSGARERLAAARAREAAEVVEARATAVDVQVELTVALERLWALEQEFDVLRTDARPAALHAIDAVRDGYVAGRGTLLDWLDAARGVLDVDMDEAGVTANLAHAVVDLEHAVGAPLPRVGLAVDQEGAR